MTLFAPAKNIAVASPAAASSYRDPRIRGGHASGTSWSAPIAAGFAARILQVNKAYTPAQVREALLANSVPTLDPLTRNSYDHLGVEILGTTDLVLRLGDVNITTQPASTPAAISGTTPLSVTAGGTGTLQYQWYEVNAGFDFATHQYGAHSSTTITGATSATFNAPAATSTKAYWARVKGSCGSADTKIAVVVPRPAPPSNLVAQANSASVTLTWTPSAGTDKYDIQRKIAGQNWVSAGTVDGATLTFTETPNGVPGGMIVYRVIALTGAAYLPPENLAASAPSNPDFANLNMHLYESLTPGATTIRAQHLIELRQAVNALCDALGLPHEFTAADVALSALQGKVMKHDDLTSLLARINNVRTHALLGLPSATFGETPTAGLASRAQHITDLRNALR